MAVHVHVHNTCIYMYVTLPTSEALDHHRSDNLSFSMCEVFADPQ